VQTHLAVEQSKIIRWSESPWNQSRRKRKGLWRKRFDATLCLLFCSSYFDVSFRCNRNVHRVDLYINCTL